jgi:anti-repressor protein
MKELIKIDESGGKQAVSARNLHSFLGVKKHFTDWMKDQIDRGLFEENIDYQAFHQKVNAGSGTSTKIDYILSLSCAKEISMLSNTEKGKHARKYFIECEEKLKALQPKLSPAELILQQAQQLVDHERRLDDIDAKIKKIETNQSMSSYTILGYAVIKKVSITTIIASELGRKATKICNEQKLETGLIPDQRFGQVRTYPKGVLEQVFNEYLHIDRNY